MNKTEFDKAIMNLFEQEVDGLSYEEKILLIDKSFDNYQINQYKKDKDGITLDLSNRRKPWADSEIRLILSDGATQKNFLKYAKMFKRGYGSIVQIHRWARTPKKVLKAKRPNNTFIDQIARIAKEVGLD